MNIELVRFVWTTEWIRFLSIQINHHAHHMSSYVPMVHILLFVYTIGFGFGFIGSSMYVTVFLEDTPHPGP